MPQSFELSEVFDAVLAEVYNAWIDANVISAFSGQSAESDARVGGRFTAGDGYIEGSYLEVEPERRIVQSWRTTDFPSEAPDSRLELEFEPLAEGTRVTLRHSEIPDGQEESYRHGWVQYYFLPLKQHLGTAGKTPAHQPTEEVTSARARALAPKKKPAAKRAPAKKKAPARKAAAKKRTPAKKKAPARKTAAKKRTPAKKAPARKAAAKKRTTTKKAPARKTAAKKRTTAKKAPARKSAAKKRTPAKKAPARKAAAKKRSAAKKR